MKNRLFIILFSGLVYFTALGETAKTTLVINSDSNVDIYSKNQKSFEKSYKGTVLSLNLSDPEWRSLDKVKSYLYDLYPDVIYCIGTKALLAANKFAPERKIVFSSTVDCFSLPKNENTYGISSRLHPGMDLMMMKMLFPKIKKVATFYSRKYQGEWINVADTEADKLELKFTSFSCDSIRGVTRNKLKYLNSFDVLWLTPDPGVFVNSDKLKMVLDYCYKYKIPVISYTSSLLAHPAVVASISGDSKTLGSQGAILVNALINDEVLGQRTFYPAGTDIRLNRRNCVKMNMEIDETTTGMVNAILE